MYSQKTHLDVVIREGDTQCYKGGLWKILTSCALKIKWLTHRIMLSATLQYLIAWAGIMCQPLRIMSLWFMNESHMNHMRIHKQTPIISD